MGKGGRTGPREGPRSLPPLWPGILGLVNCSGEVKCHGNWSREASRASSNASRVPGSQGRSPLLSVAFTWKTVGWSNDGIWLWYNWYYLDGKSMVNPSFTLAIARGFKMISNKPKWSNLWTFTKSWAPTEQNLDPELWRLAKNDQQYIMPQILTHDAHLCWSIFWQ